MHSAAGPAGWQVQNSLLSWLGLCCLSAGLPQFPPHGLSSSSRLDWFSWIAMEGNIPEQWKTDNERSHKAHPHGLSPVMFCLSADGKASPDSWRWCGSVTLQRNWWLFNDLPQVATYARHVGAPKALSQLSHTPILQCRHSYPCCIEHGGQSQKSLLTQSYW